RPVLLLDASGSMSQYSPVFLRFMLALLKHLPDGEGYLFHTRLVEIGPVLRERRRVAALERLSLMAEGWGGGTRIGECLSIFVKHHARRALRGRSILFILSDGYETELTEELSGKVEPFENDTAVRTCASVAAKPGAKPILSADGRMAGWIGGGCALGAVKKAAQRCLQDGEARLISVMPSGQLEAQ